jgi:Peptidase family M28/PA domain
MKLVTRTLLVAVILVFHVDHLSAQLDTMAMRYAKTITVGELKEHLYELSSDAYEGRETGMPGQKKAAAYIADYYKSLGIAPVVNGSYYQQYPLKRVRYGESNFQLGDQKFSFKEDFYFFGHDGEAEIDASQIAFVGFGIEDPKYNDYNGVDVSGKTLMCLSGEPKDKAGNSLITGTNGMSEWSEDFRKKMDLAQAKGAKAIIIIEGDFDNYITRIRYWLDQPRLTLDYSSSQDEKTISYFFISPKLADIILKAGKSKPSAELRKKIEKKKKSKVVLVNSTLKIHVKQDVERIYAENILAFIEGSDPVLKNEIVVVSAHYDHIGIVNGQINNGADDDGSGTVGSLEIAEAFQLAKNEGHGSKRSILILNVSGEEKGLLGSEWYSEFPVYPLNSTVCDLNIDMIGRHDEQHEKQREYVYLIGSDKLSTQLHSLSEKCNSDYTKLSLDYTFNDPEDPNRFYYRSDHYNFAKHGIPVIFYFSGVHEDYHQPGDDPEKIEFEKMSTIVKLVFHTAWEVANRKEKLVVDVENNFEK